MDKVEVKQRCLIALVELPELTCLTDRISQFKKDHASLSVEFEAVVVLHHDDLPLLAAQQSIDIIIVKFDANSWSSASRLMSVSAQYRQTVVVAYIEDWSPSSALAALAKGGWDTLSPTRIDAEANVFYFNKLFDQGRRLGAAWIQRERFIGITNQISDAILITDVTRHIRFVNQAAHQLLGQSPLELLGEPVPFDLKREENRRFQWTGPSGQTKTIDGVEYSLPKLPHEEALLCMILRDVTEQTKFIDQVIASKRIADQTLEIHSRFMATATHEIRTPLGGVLGAASLLLQSPLNDQQRELAHVIQDSVEQLRTLVSDLLDIDKIDKGHIDITKADFDCCSFFERVEQLFASPIKESGLKLCFKGVSQLPKTLRADAVHIRQILINLINNAIKFTPKGSITVSARWLADPGQLNIEVADSGVGISNEDAQKLFKPFVQLDNLPEKSQRTRGTGLGLSICERLCTQMGGSIGYRPSIGGGSTFYFMVAAEAANDGAKQPSEDRSKIQALPSAQEAPFLVVDDDPINCSIAQRMLVQLGYKVKTTHGGQEALDLLQREKVCALLLDCRMPGIDGFEVVRTLRAAKDEANSQIFVIAVTGHNLNVGDERCKEAGISATLRKPYSITELESCLKKMP